MPSELYYPSGSASLDPDIVKTGTFTSTTFVTIWTPTSGKSIVLFGMLFGVSSAVASQVFTVRYDSTDFANHYQANTVPVLYTFQNGLRIFPIDGLLKLKTSVSGGISYTVWGTEI